MLQHYAGLKKDPLASTVKSLDQESKGNIQELLERLKKVNVHVPDDPADLNVSKLEFILLSLGLPINGKKNELVERVRTATSAGSDMKPRENSPVKLEGDNGDGNNDDQTEDSDRNRDGHLRADQNTRNMMGNADDGNDQTDRNNSQDESDDKSSDDQKTGNSGSSSSNNSKDDVMLSTESDTDISNSDMNGNSSSTPFRSPSPKTQDDLNKRYIRASTDIIAQAPQPEGEENPQIITLTDDPDHPGHTVSGQILLRTSYRSCFLVTLPSLTANGALRGVLVRATDYPKAGESYRGRDVRGRSKTTLESHKPSDYRIVLTAATERMDFCIVLLRQLKSNSWEVYNKSTLDQHFGKSQVDEAVNKFRARVGQGDLIRPRQRSAADSKTQFGFEPIPENAP